MIPEMREKIKGRVGEIFLLLACLLGSLLLVGGIRLWQLKTPKFQIKIEERAFPIQGLESPETESEKAFVASKNGSVYYPAACPSARRISIENRLFFASALEAEKGGFRPSKQCK